MVLKPARAGSGSISILLGRSRLDLAEIHESTPSEMRPTFDVFAGQAAEGAHQDGAVDAVALGGNSSYLGVWP